MAALFCCSARTIARAEPRYGLQPLRKNSRVLFYSIDDVKLLVAGGYSLNATEARGLGLDFTEIAPRPSAFESHGPAHLASNPIDPALLAGLRNPAIAAQILAQISALHFPN